ncbi:hypothetical protein TBLA_0A07490 [Henningerozyma blattae CBS 6284]|uniref:Cytidyltransferase-like domain-containing protein n=1 Tax=Henningerozyma blattae (strain ATCC 34711 / CBS 6284 / DSM 70876 / NBRC 10599 / NRRL Y-10934 / UCD 77-7) TaxID=1071380 RepID=I2GWN7_HENB6|nr:hypothetical protein TBLA_0A07490 [Tetrapisispora blattae CBS 6284]CCH58539.1 hypothetical protein TBLA_0A07490 [Tetrapisispora blattae CBS 6284]
MNDRHDSLKIINDFISNNLPFKVVSNSIKYSTPIIDSDDNSRNILLILDSSFNPPHWAHYTIISRAIEYYKSLGYISIRVMLLLSIENADKKPKPASFHERLDMLQIMAGIVCKQESIDTIVSITRFSKFVDKEKMIRGYNKTDKIVFLLGFDTATRLFEPKYYLPQTVPQALEKFMENTELFCLTRGSNEETISEQLSLPAEIKSGKYEPNILKEWASKIHVISNRNQYKDVSSSTVRHELLTGTPIKELENQVPKEILNYIQNSGASIFS